jgi:phosphoglucosamine mutase
VRFGTDGVRGVANTELTASFALDLGRAAARVLAPSRAVVGGDTRMSTPMLEAAVTAGLAAEGVEVHQLGVLPTPAVAFEAARLGAMGVVVSASHNPYRDNGIKLFAPGGTKLPDDVEDKIEAELAGLTSPTGEPGVVVDAAEGPRRDELVAAYVRHVVDVLGGRTLAGMRVVVDAANGSAAPIAHQVLARAGATVTTINDRPDGRNINHHCGATDPAGLAAAVVELGAAAGLALDGDADRLIAVDERGDVVDGDQVMAICAADMHRRGVLRGDTVVVTVMTNLGFRLAMRAAGVQVVETPVGDRYVLEALRRGGYSLGGEQSGHVIFHDRATTGDGLLTGLALLDVVARSHRPLSELAAASMTRLPQVLVNVPVAERVPDVADLLAGEIVAAEFELGDSGRVLVRPSGTEPLVRVMVEAPTREVAQRTADELADRVVERFGAV